MTEALRISYEPLKLAEQQAARLLAQLGPEPIPQRVIESFGDAFSPSTRTALVAGAWVTRASAMDGIAVGAVPLFGRMHQVVADFLRTQSSDPDADRALARRALIAAMTGTDNPRAWPVLNLCVPHVEAISRRASLLEDTAETRETAELGFKIAHLWYVQGLFSVARSDLKRISESAERQFGSEDPLTLTAMINLAATLDALGKLDRGRELAERVLDVRRRVSGYEHPDTVTAMNNLAAILYTLGELDRARELQKRVLDIRRRVLGDEHRETLTVMNNLAETLRAQDDLTGAGEWQERALDVARRVFGDEHPNTLIAMNNLAGTRITAPPIAT